jgi:tight adherence protein C
MSGSPTIIGLLFAGALCLVLYAGYQLFRDVPTDDSTYRDRPPLLYRMTWPIILFIAFNARWLISEKVHDRSLRALERAGQDYALTPVQFIAGKIVSAVVAGIFAWFMSDLMSVKPLGLIVTAMVLGYFYPNLWLQEQTKKRNLKILKALPFFIDLLTLSVEAGLNLSGGLVQASTKSPAGPLNVEVNRVLREVRAGKSRIDALRAFAERLDFGPITSFVSAIIQGETTGSSLGPILRAQADQRRSERFLRAEKLAMEAPIKMLGPLIIFIFPCTFIIIGFPIVMKFLASGI